MTVKRPDDGEREGVWVAALGSVEPDREPIGLDSVQLDNDDLVIYNPTDGYESEWLQSDLVISPEDAT